MLDWDNAFTNNTATYEKASKFQIFILLIISFLMKYSGNRIDRQIKTITHTHKKTIPRKQIVSQYQRN